MPLAFVLASHGFHHDIRKAVQPHGCFHHPFRITTVRNSLSRFTSRFLFSEAKGKASMLTPEVYRQRASVMERNPQFRYFLRSQFGFPVAEEEVNPSMTSVTARDRVYERQLQNFRRKMAQSWKAKADSKKITSVELRQQALESTQTELLWVFQKFDFFLVTDRLQESLGKEALP